MPGSPRSPLPPARPSHGRQVLLTLPCCFLMVERDFSTCPLPSKMTFLPWSSQVLLAFESATPGLRHWVSQDCFNCKGQKIIPANLNKNKKRGWLAPAAAQLRQGRDSRNHRRWPFDPARPLPALPSACPCVCLQVALIPLQQRRLHRVVRVPATRSSI